MGLKIRGSVGINGTNSKNDVKAVQQFLNDNQKRIGFTRLLVVDGSLGRSPHLSKTVEAIKVCQRKLLYMVKPDGRIDVNGRTHRKLNGLPSYSSVKNDPHDAQKLVT